MKTNRTLLCTTGTSIARDCPSLRDLQKRPTTWDEDAPALREEIRKRLAEFDLTGKAGLREVSAELNVLERLRTTPSDEIVLLVTDTADGRICAEELARAINSCFGNAAVRLERINDLQVRDAEALRRSGIMHLVRRLIHYLEDPQRHYAGGCVLCPNGGFKGVVPFMGALGMLFRVPVMYVFEFANCLISLPPLPLSLAGAHFERALPALRWARTKAVFREEEFFQRIPGFHEDERPWFSAFLEKSGDGLAALSPLIEVIVERESAIGSGLMLSAEAAAALDAAKGNDLLEMKDHLRKLASPLWRSQHRSTKRTSDLEFYPTGHNPWRFAGFTRDGVFHLCWFARHDEYERQIPLPSRQMAAFAEDTFTPWRAGEPAPADSSETDPLASCSWQDLRDRLRTAEKTSAHLKDQLAKRPMVENHSRRSKEEAHGRPTRKRRGDGKSGKKRPKSSLPPALEALDQALRDTTEGKKD